MYLDKKTIIVAFHFFKYGFDEYFLGTAYIYLAYAVLLFESTMLCDYERGWVPIFKHNGHIVGFRQVKYFAFES